MFRQFRVLTLMRVQM